jgi:hypothetical protein
LPRQSKALAENLGRRLMILDRARRSVDASVQTGILAAKGAEVLYEGLFLGAFTAFEGFLEELFVGLLVTGAGITPSRAGITPRVTVRRHDIAREVILGSSHRKYVDWLPYEHTERRARILFRSGRPFADLGAQERSALAQSNYIRNAIAHKSRHSIAQFERHVIGSVPLPPRERRPGAYLRSIFRTSPAQTRLEAITEGLARTARVLAT